MNIYKDYIQEIEERKTQGLHPKPIDGAELLGEIIA
jgi:aconitate hydratase 2/2-methylisocitrate dehydratase